MALVSPGRILNSRGKTRLRRVLMANSITIFQGALVMVSATGFGAIPAANAGNKGVVGIATETKTSGTGGNDWIKVEQGSFLVSAVSIAQANVYSLMFAVDDENFDETNTGNLPIAGMLEEFISATSGWIDIGPQYNT